MENGDFVKDDFLKKLIREHPLDKTSDDFVDEVMKKIQAAPVRVPVRKPFFLFIRNSWPYALVSFIIIVVFMTSDLPFTGFIPGKEYLTNILLPYFSSLFGFVKDYVGGIKNISVIMTIVAAGGFLLLLDHWIFRRPKMQDSMIF